MVTYHVFSDVHEKPCAEGEMGDASCWQLVSALFVPTARSHPITF
jgi:hypothetical protein